MLGPCQWQLPCWEEALYLPDLSDGQGGVFTAAPCPSASEIVSALKRELGVAVETLVSVDDDEYLYNSWLTDIVVEVVFPTLPLWWVFIIIRIIIVSCYFLGDILMLSHLAACLVTVTNAWISCCSDVTQWFSFINIACINISHML